ncbi:MAG: transcriptional regulator [Caulobacterales bacterium]|nr:transcriptional regulator [Caulobacterales bacterium]
MAGKRSYDDGCLVAQALERVGERWALLVARELLFGPRRFGELQADLRGVSPNVLSQRLADLTTAGVLAHRQLPGAPNLWTYELTPWGRELEPALAALGAWAALAPSTDDKVSAAAAIFALRAASHPVEGSRFDLKVDLSGRVFHVRLGRQRLKVEAWGDGGADATVVATPEVFHRLVFQDRDLDAAIKAGAVTWKGDRKAFQRLLAFVPAAAKAPPAWMADAD